ncbi:peptidase M24A, methionine aminopeptidase, partial [Aureobasidium melanogenum]
LDGGANVGHAHIDTGFPDTSVRCILDSGEQVVVGGVEGHGEGTVDDATVDVSTEIDLHDVSLLENCLVTSIGGVVGSAVVDAQTSRETHASSDVVALFKTLMAGQVAHAILDTLSNLSQGLSRLDVLLGPLADLSVNFGGVAVLGEIVVAHAIKVSLLLVGGTVRVVVDVFANLSFGECAIGEELCNGDSWRAGLALCGSAGGLLLLSGLSLLLFLCSAFFGSVVGTFGVVAFVFRIVGMALGALLCFGGSSFGQVALGLLH